MSYHELLNNVDSKHIKPGIIWLTILDIDALRYDLIIECLSNHLILSVYGSVVCLV